MISIEATHDQAMSRSNMEPMASSPRISFSSEFLDDNDFISITPSSHHEIHKLLDMERDQSPKAAARNAAEFEFLSNANSSTNTMLTADELFFEGKLLPYCQMERLNKLTIKPKEEVVGVFDREDDEKEEIRKEEINKMSWFIDEDPSPRPPKCTVLWKELLRLRKQRANSPLSSSSSSSSLADTGSERPWSGEKHVKRIKQRLERTRSASIRIRPVVNVPICTQVKSSVLPPLFSLKKGNVER
ncbi:hypothetical protein Syun_007507 [Stephania yunnanensis]|uniref:Uncharacterized protein n=1 Tax=Stephania yunnanensis TaxID=152371 RepID=A0AAP0KYQ5_9MAGN